MPEAFCGIEIERKKGPLNLWVLWEKKLPSVKEKPPQRVTCVSSHRVGASYFSQIYTEEQNTQRPTETLSQPISQNLTATFSSNALWTLYAGGLLWARNCAQKCSVNSVRSVRDKTPQQVVCVSSHRVGAFFFSQKNTEEQNTQHSTETLSQPISQSVTAIFSWNVLWYLYAGGLLWVRNCAQKDSVKSVSSVRERNTLCERRNSPATFVVIISSRGCVLFLTEVHRRTEHTAFHRDIKSTDNTERYSQNLSTTTHL